MPCPEYASGKVYHIPGAEVGTLVAEQLPAGRHHLIIRHRMIT